MAAKKKRNNPSARRSASPPTAAGPSAALRRSALAVLAVAVIVAVWAFWPGRGGHDRPPAMTPPAALPEPVLPKIPFTDVTAESGIAFRHVNGADGEKLLPETMGSGCAFFDYDNDGAPDLLLVNSCRWPWSANPSGEKPTMRLYHNDGRGHFTDVTAGSGLDVSFYGMGVAVGDYDNDGLVDVFVTGVGENHLFKNMGGGKFRDVTAEAGVGGSGAWSTSAAFIDYDNDGKLDLFVCNYVDWSRDKDAGQGFELPGVGRAYGPPLAFGGSHCLLYHNNGDGTFTDVSGRAGIRVNDPRTGRPMAKALAVKPIDLDGDGFIDLIVANDTVQNFVFHNRRDGTFEEIGAVSGMGFDATGQARGAMGIDAAHFRNDASLGVAVGNFEAEMNALYVSRWPDLSFRDEAANTGVAAATRNVLTFGLFFFDADLDGRLDLFMVNGHLEPEIHRAEPTQAYRQAPILLWNAGPGYRSEFVPMGEAQCGPALLRLRVARGASYADIDGDGDLDVLITQNAGPPVLLRNDQRLGRHFLRLKLTGNGRTSNRDAIGAWVEVRSAGRTLRRQVMPTRSYLSQVELPVTIGLGESTKADEVTVTWPDGRRDRVEGAKLDRLTEVKERD